MHTDTLDVHDVRTLSLVRDFDHMDKLQPNKVWWKLIVHTDKSEQAREAQPASPVGE